MTKQIHVTVSANHYVLNVVDHESISIHVDSMPQFEQPNPSPILNIKGLRWLDEKHYHLEWVENLELSEGEEVAIGFADSGAPATTPAKVEEYVKPEKECGFCSKKASEVELLIERNFLNRICNECVDVCAETIRKNREQNSD